MQLFQYIILLLGYLMILLMVFMVQGWLSKTNLASFFYAFIALLIFLQTTLVLIFMVQF